MSSIKAFHYSLKGLVHNCFVIGTLGLINFLCVFSLFLFPSLCYFSFFFYSLYFHLIILNEIMKSLNTFCDIVTYVQVDSIDDSIPYVTNLGKSGSFFWAILFFQFKNIKSNQHHRMWGICINSEWSPHYSREFKCQKMTISALFVQLCVVIFQTHALWRLQYN